MPWSWSHRYRYEKGDWIRVGGNRSSDFPHEDSSDQIDRDFVTGLVTQVTNERGHHVEKTFYELRPSNPSRPPTVDGLRQPAEWPAREARIGPKRIRAGAVFVMGSLYVWAEYPVELRSSQGKLIKPDEERRHSIYEARFGGGAINWPHMNGNVVEVGEARLWMSLRGAPDVAVSVLLPDEDGFDPVKLR